MRRPRRDERPSGGALGGWTVLPWGGRRVVTTPWSCQLPPRPEPAVSLTIGDCDDSVRAFDNLVQANEGSTDANDTCGRSRSCAVVGCERSDASDSYARRSAT